MSLHNKFCLDKELALLRKNMNQAKKDYSDEEQKRNQQLDTNRELQRKLRAELERLEREEEWLIKESTDGKKLQEDAEKVSRGASVNHEGRWSYEIAMLGPEPVLNVIVGF